MDLRAGWVVRGVAGRRDEYRHVQSQLSADARPRSIAKALAARYGFPRGLRCRSRCDRRRATRLGGVERNRGVRLRIWIDAGIGDCQRAEAMLASARAASFLDAIIVGLESVDDAAVLPELVQLVGAERAVFSLDLYGWRPFSERPALARSDGD